jgi:hypothetical protein
LQSTFPQDQGYIAFFEKMRPKDGVLFDCARLFLKSHFDEALEICRTGPEGAFGVLDHDLL